MASCYDAVVVGSGPNGLTAAITLARSGLSVLVVEAQSGIGGGLRSAEDTLPGFVHDRGATVHALALASPVMRSIPLAEHGVRLAHPPHPLAHPLDGGRAVLAHRDVAATAAGLGPDERSYLRLMGPLVDASDEILADVLAPARVPRHPVALARFGVRGAWSSNALGQMLFGTEEAEALLAGAAAHSMLPLSSPLSAAVGLVLGMTAHSVGWPVAVGGSQSVADALASYLRTLGGTVRTDHPAVTLGDLPRAAVVMLDTPPSTVLRLAGPSLPAGYRRRLERFRYGAGVFKIDWALDGPVPWTHPEVAKAATVHLGGTRGEISAAEAEVMRGGHPRQPYVLLVQPTVADPSRAPAGRHTLWAYTHVPAGSPVDMTARVEAQIERFAPGFRDRVLARRTWSPADLERSNPSLLRGVISGGSQDLRQVFTRPVGLRQVLDPYPVPAVSGSRVGRARARLFLCSSSTPPGGGAHGMSGYWAARSALTGVFGLTPPPPGR